MALSSQPQQQSHYSEVVHNTQNPTQPLQADVVDKLINVEVKIFRNKLARFLHNAEEVEVEFPTYETRKKLLLDDAGRPRLDDNKRPIYEEIQIKVGSEKRTVFKPLYAIQHI